MKLTRSDDVCVVAITKHCRQIEMYLTLFPNKVTKYNFYVHGNGKLRAI